MNVLLIGGTGNLSADCAAWLHQHGHAVAVTTRGQSAVPAEYRAVRADRHDAAALRAALAGWQPAVVINFLGYGVADVETDFALFHGQVRQYVFISSATVYSKPPRELPITESAPLGNAFWDYAQKKLACEEWLRDCARRDGFPVTIVRPSHTYSPRWIPNPVSSGSYMFAARLERGLPVFVPDDGETAWTLTAASDFAAGLGGLVGNEKAIGEAVHITSDEVLTWNRIYAETADALGVKDPIIERVPTDFICQVAPQLTGNLKGDKSNPAVFDNRRIKQLVPGFECRKSFREGIREAVSWFRAHPDRQSINEQANAVFDQVIAAWRHRGTVA